MASNPKVLRDILNEQEQGLYIKADNDMKLWCVEIQDLTTKHCYEIANILGISPAVFVVRIISNL